MTIVEVQHKIEQLARQLVNIRGYFEGPDFADQLAEIDREMETPGFWDDPSRSAPLLRKRRTLERRLETLKRLQDDGDELDAWRELVAEGEADDELSTFLRRLDGDLQRLDLELKLAGEDDDKNALIEIRPGAGGVDAADWAEMLLRMYVRWAEKKGFGADLLDRQDAEEAGIKSCTLAVRGENAYGLLRSENGVHRLVRISPFDQQSRRQTSFASVDLYPEVDDDVEVEVNDKDLRVDTYRASGAGGQHVNKTESAVRITHLPTGIVVSCQNERSQLKNRATAMKVLRARLYDREVQLREAERAEKAGEKPDIGWGSQIRSYVLAPYRMVKDHRTNLEMGDADAVIDGAIDPFIESWLKFQMTERESSTS
ncbi:MAG: peptide chain release factor 2 [Acidobacteriota bacterium]